MIEFSFIIPVTRRDLLDKCLDSLKQMDYPSSNYEIILITDKKLKNLPELDIKQIEMQDRNPALRRNKGVKLAKAPLIAFIDDDVTVNKNWLKNSQEIFKKNPEITGIGGPDKMPPDSSFLEKVTDALLSHSYFGSGVLAHSYYNKRKMIKYPSSIALCNMLIKREVFDLVDFNENIGYGGEDTEFLYILMKAYHKKFLYDPSIYVYHKKRKFGLAYFKQRLKFRINNGKLLYIYPCLFLKNKKFFLFFFGVTFGIFLLFIAPKVFLGGLAFYFLLLIITSLEFIKKDVKIFLLLPILLFVQHIIYYVGIIIGLFSIFNYSKLKKIKRL